MVFISKWLIPLYKHTKKNTRASPKNCRKMVRFDIYSFLTQKEPIFSKNCASFEFFIVLPLAVFSSIGFFVSICLRSPIKQINQLKFTKKRFFILVAKISSRNCLCSYMSHIICLTFVLLGNGDWCWSLIVCDDFLVLVTEFRCW